MTQKLVFFFIFLFLLLSTFLFSHLERFLPFFYYTFFWDDVSNESRLIRRSNSIRIIKYWHDQIKSKKKEWWILNKARKEIIKKPKQTKHKKKMPKIISATSGYSQESCKDLPFILNVFLRSSSVLFCRHWLACFWSIHLFETWNISSTLPHCCFTLLNFNIFFVNELASKKS